MFQDILSFEGRNNRAKYWTIRIFVSLFIVAAAMFDSAIFGESAGRLVLVAVLIAFVPSLANQIKRWHDRDKSGFWVFIVFVPVIGSLWVLIENGFLRGTDGPNKYGPDPLNPHKLGGLDDDDFEFKEKQPDDLI